MNWSVGLQLAGVVALAGLGTMLLVLGVFGSGGLCLAAAAFWFWRMYRVAE